MKCRRALLAAAGLTILAAMNCLASDVIVIANPSVRADTISADDLKLVFLEKKNALADDTPVEPVLEKDGPVNESFLREYLDISQNDLQTNYQMLLFTGKGFLPKVFGSDAEVVAHVARTRGAIGYVSSASSVEGVRILTIGLPANAERRLITRVEPDYPQTLKRLNIGGTVRLRISISPQGNVGHVELLGGNPILGESAITAVKKWTYAQGRSQTQTVITITFGP